MLWLALAAWLAVSDADRGLALLRQREFAQAETLFRTALAARPADAITRLHLARTLIELNRLPEALAEIERAAPPHASPEVRFQAGALLRELASRRATQLARAAPGSAAVDEMTGERLELEGKFSDALKAYRAAAAKEPARSGIHYRIGSVLWKQRDLAGAEESLRLELSHAPHHGMANLRLGETLIAKGDEAAAIPFLERVPESLEARRELGKAYRKTGRSADARRVWEEVARMRPQDPQIHFLLGGLYRELGEAELARQEMEKHKRILSRTR